MKRLIALLGIAVTAAFTVQAQHIRIGPEIGVNFNKWDVHHRYYDDNYDMKAGLKVGGIVDVPLGRMISFQAGIFFSGKGTEQHYTTGTDIGLVAHVEQKYKVNYLEIPLNLQFKFGHPYRTHFFVGAGPYIAFAIGGEIEYDNVLTYSNGAYVRTERGGRDLEIGDHYGDDVNGFDAGLNINLGIACRSGLFVRGNMGLGLSNVIPDVNGSYTAKNFGLGLSVGYLFGR